MKSKCILVLSILVFYNVVADAQITNYAVQDSNQVDYELIDFIDSDRHTLLAFWAEWCVPCRWELNSWKDYTENWIQNENINLLAISIDDIENRDSAIVMWNENEWQGELLFGSAGFSITRYYLYNKDENLIVEKTGFTNGNEIVLDSIIKSLNTTTGLSDYSIDPLRLEREGDKVKVIGKNDYQRLTIGIYSMEGVTILREDFSLNRNEPKFFTLPKNQIVIVGLYVDGKIIKSERFMVI